MTLRDVVDLGTRWWQRVDTSVALLAEADRRTLVLFYGYCGAAGIVMGGILAMLAAVL
jgi:hypothetical protein